MKVKSLSRAQLVATPSTTAHQAPLFMGFSRQEDWSGVHLTSQRSYTRLNVNKYLVYGRPYLFISILKSRDITLPTKVCLVKAMVFTVVMYGCESWTIKKAEC